MSGIKQVFFFKYYKINGICLVNILLFKNNNCKNSLQNIQSSTNVIQENNTHDYLCLICSPFKKKSGEQKQYPTFTNSKEVITEIKYFAEVLNDSKLLQNLQACEEIYYHCSCRMNLQKKKELKLESKNRKQTWYENQEIHKEAFESLVIFLKEEIIQKEKNSIRN